MRGKIVISILYITLLFNGFIHAHNTDNFINNYYWYNKYLPPENIAEYQTLRNTLIFLKENDNDAFWGLSGDLNEHIIRLNSILFQILNREMQRTNQKMIILVNQFKSNIEVMNLHEEFEIFDSNISSYSLPNDDFCLARVDELYSRMITRINYRERNRNISPDRGFVNDFDYHRNGYLVQEGDYLRLIALKCYNNSSVWQIIWRDEINYANRQFLPNPENADLIYPGVIIRIPFLQ
ncbi:MAG: hypothetical protein FWB83_00515 [Treponema sp.]|nr:hypothetical protein [Treponema sp.]